MSKKKIKPKDSQVGEVPFSAHTEWTEAMESLDSESDRAVALIAAAHIETALRSMLRSTMVDSNGVAERLFDSPTAPLGTFSSNIAIAYGLGYIGPNTLKTLDSIREVRNAFAHFRRAMSFEDPEIRRWIESTLPFPIILPHPAPNMNCMRTRFIWTTKYLLDRISYIRRNAVRPTSPNT